MTRTAYVPRINHVAISVDADVLNEEGRADLLSFYGEVFGWTEGDNSTEQGNPLILMVGALRQFIYLLPATGNFMVTPRGDHFGLEVASKEDLLEILERARTYQAKDDRVRITEVGTMVTHHANGDHTLTNAYIGFLIPLSIELQHIERQADD
jgi:hypothetical protein